MPIVVTCPRCNTQLRVQDAHVGKSIQCPKCSQLLQPELPAEELNEAIPVVHPVEGLRAEAGGQRQGRRRRFDYDDLDDNDEELPQKPRRRRQGGYAPCPSCGSTHATRVMWTLWGSFYGPAMFTHVRCSDCNTSYNGRSGRSNLIPAVIFVMVPLMLLIIICGALAWWLWSIGPGQRGMRRGDTGPPPGWQAPLIAGGVRLVSPGRPFLCA
jgi:hypothetical protein